VNFFSLLPNLTPSQGLRTFLFAMKFYWWDHIYVHNKSFKFQGQNIYTKKDIRNLPTRVVLREFSLLPTLTPSQGLKNYFFTVKFFTWNPLYVVNIWSKFQVEKIHPQKDIQNLPTCVVVRKFSLLPTLTPSQGLKNCLFMMKFLLWDHLYVYAALTSFSQHSYS